jgi:hypothetical protein
MQPQRPERVRAFLGARILFRQGNSTLDCRVRDISLYGAKLVMSSTVALPEEFDLTIPQKGRRYRCVLRWRRADQAGVKFLTSVSERGHDALAEGTKVRELEAENDLLRRRVRDLRDRLTALSKA